MKTALEALMVGAVAGLHTATWGMYKDSLYEGFTWRTYSRSVLVGAVAALLVQAMMRLDLHRAGGLIVLFAMAYVVERGVVEFYKSFVRREDQSKYFIPMQFAVAGRVVHDRRARALAGASYAAGVALVVAGVIALERHGSGAGPATTALILGSVGGWVSALGGAWKDAPKEGFQLFKFFRSPAIAALYGLVLGSMTTSYLVIAFGALGFTIATIETYKTFAKARTPRGKFAGMPVRFPEMESWRRPFAGVYAAIWMAVLVTFGTALAASFDGVLVTGLLARLP